MTSKGYCPNCKKNVKKKKVSFSFLKAFFLAFTGIGLIIYILYYLDQKPKYCKICDTKCEPFQAEDKSEQPKELENAQAKITDEKVQFCHSCGTKIEYGEEAQFCNYCGDNVV